MTDTFLVCGNGLVENFQIIQVFKPYESQLNLTSLTWLRFFI